VRARSCPPTFTKAKNHVTLKLEVPGIDEKDLDIRVKNKNLVIKGERKFEKEAVAARAFRGRVRRLLQAHVAARARALLNKKVVDRERAQSLPVKPTFYEQVDGVNAANCGDPA
jgi:HSP20 family molecular chaperone IbpA